MCDGKEMVSNSIFKTKLYFLLQKIFVNNMLSKRTNTRKKRKGECCLFFRETYGFLVIHLLMYLHFINNTEIIATSKIPGTHFKSGP